MHALRSQECVDTGCGLPVEGLHMPLVNSILNRHKLLYEDQFFTRRAKGSEDGHQIIQPDFAPACICKTIHKKYGVPYIFAAGCLIGEQQ